MGIITKIKDSFHIGWITYNFEGKHYGENDLNVEIKEWIRNNITTDSFSYQYMARNDFVIDKVLFKNKEDFILFKLTWS